MERQIKNEIMSKPAEIGHGCDNDMACSVVTIII